MKKLSFQQFSYPDKTEYVIVFNQYRMDNEMIGNVISHLKETYLSVVLHPNRIYPRSLNNIFHFDDKDDEAAFQLLMSPWVEGSNYDRGDFVTSRTIELDV